MKRVLIDCRYWGPSHTGLGRYTQALVTAMHQQKHPQEVFLIVSSEAKRMLVRSKLVNNYKLVVSNVKPYSLAEQFEIPRLVKKINPDLTHFLHFNVPILMKSPFVVTIHDLIKHHSSGVSTTTRSIIVYYFKRIGYYLTIKRAIKNSQQIITPSAWVKKDILKNYSIESDKVKVIYEAADAPFIALKPERVRPLKEKYLLYVGNAYPHKNLDLLIKALKLINRQQHLTLVIVTGRDVFYQRLRNQIKTLKASNFIKIKGFSSDQELKNLYAHAFAFITPSLLEGFGLPGLEAMASKTLVISSQGSCLPEIYKDVPIYFNPKSVDDLVKKINFALKLSPSKIKSLHQKGLKLVSQYSWQKAAINTLKVYESCSSLRSSQ